MSLSPDPVTTVAFEPVGAENGRRSVPAGATAVANQAALETEIAKVLPGGSNAGASVDLYLSGSLYNEIGINSYSCTDGGGGLNLWGKEDGTTEIRYTGVGMADAHSSVFRLKNGFNRGGLYNVRLNGASTGNNVGAIWGAALGGSYDIDPNRGDVFDFVMVGVEVHNTQNSGVKVDGNGGTDGVLVDYVTVRDVGMQYSDRDGVQGIGEGIYTGDGNTGRAYANVTISNCHVYDLLFGEGINTKRNGTNVAIENCLVHDVVIDNGGGISCEGYTEVLSCRVFNISVNTRSDTNFPACINFIDGGLVQNSIAWASHSNGSCIRLADFPASTSTVTARHNTLYAVNARTCYSLNEFNGGGQKLVATDNLYGGTHTSGSNGAGGSINDFVAGTFVGPTTGAADSGSGSGSGFELASGSGRNSVSAITVTFDIQGYDRVAPTDAGAIDADATSAAPDEDVPVLVWSSPTADTLFDTGDTILVSGTATDTGGSGVASVSLEVRHLGSEEYYDINGDSWGTTPLWNTLTVSGSSWSADIPLPTDGRYQFRAYATDVSTNESVPLTRSITAETRAFEIVVPADGAVGVATTGFTLSGNAPFKTTSVQVRITNDTDGLVLAESGSYVPDTVAVADEYWLDCTYSSGGFTFGPYTQPTATDMSIDARRLEA